MATVINMSSKLQFPPQDGSVDANIYFEEVDKAISTAFNDLSGRVKLLESNNSNMEKIIKNLQAAQALFNITPTLYTQSVTTYNEAVESREQYLVNLPESAKYLVSGLKASIVYLQTVKGKLTETLSRSIPYADLNSTIQLRVTELEESINKLTAKEKEVNEITNQLPNLLTAEQGNIKHVEKRLNNKGASVGQLKNVASHLFSMVYSSTPPAPISLKEEGGGEKATTEVVAQVVDPSAHTILAVEVVDSPDQDASNEDNEVFHDAQGPLGRPKGGQSKRPYPCLIEQMAR